MLFKPLNSQGKDQILHNCSINEKNRKTPIIMDMRDKNNPFGCYKQIKLLKKLYSFAGP